MDAAVFTYLNMLPSLTPALGRLAVLVGRDAIFLYSLLLLWLWMRAGQTADGGRRILLLVVFAALLSPRRPLSAPDACFNPSWIS